MGMSHSIIRRDAGSSGAGQSARGVGISRGSLVGVAPNISLQIAARARKVSVVCGMIAKLRLPGEVFPPGSRNAARSVSAGSGPC